MVKPFTIAIAEQTLVDLRQRLEMVRFPPLSGSDNWEDGANPIYLRDLVEYWRDRFDWSAQEKMLNCFSHYLAPVDGTTIHFIWEKGQGPAPMPLLLSHGYPDSFFRFYKLIPLLTNPAAYNGDSADAFDVVVPSLPGYAFSQARPDKGGIFGFGDLWHQLMTKCLGYDRFGAHGGDWGSTISEHLARSHSESMVGIHLTDVPFWHALQKPKQLSSDEIKYIEASNRFQMEGGAYATDPRHAATDAGHRVE